MRVKAKILATLSVALLAATAFSSVAFADELTDSASSDSTQTTVEAPVAVTPVSPQTLVGKTFTVKGYTYKITSLTYKNWQTGKATVTLIKYGSSKKSAVVPGSVKKSLTFSSDNKTSKAKHSVSFAVTEIGASAFNNSKGHKITKVTIGANVKKIGDKAFKNCKKLTKVVVKGENIFQVGSNKGSSNAKKLQKLKKKWKTGSSFSGTPRTCRVTVPKPKGLNFGYTENVRQLFGHAGFKGVVSW